MIVTPFALIGLLLGLMLLFSGSVVSMFRLFLLSTLFGGSATFILVALGGSSIPPAQFLLVFIVARCILPGSGQMQALKSGIWANRFLIIFTLYGAASAFTLPLLFHHMVDVTPLKPIVSADLYAVLPLEMSGQNITTAIYLFGTMFAGIAAYIGMCRPGGAIVLVRTGTWIAFTHAFFGITSVILAGTAWDSFLQLFRNGNYAQLNQSFEGLVRMNGIWPEPSGFAGYGSVWCIFMLELWARNILPARTGPAGLILAGALIVSTSSTAYVSLGAYSLYFLLRSAVLPWGLAPRKRLAILVTGLLASIAILTLIIAVPALVDYCWKLLNLMTVKKAESVSGLQRAFWAWQGIDVFFASYGLGIGAGSFRSSSVLTAILGSVGVVGSVAFLAHFIASVRPFAKESYLLLHLPPDRAIGCAASTTALIMLVPASVSAPSPDPGVLWAIMCGSALALRTRPFRKSGEDPLKKRASVRPATVTADTYTGPARI